MNGWLLLIPLISALVGWLIQSVAVIMLFRPSEPIKILGYSIQGFIPGRKALLAEKLGAAAAGFVSFEEIEKKISDPGNFKKILPSIEEHIDHFLRVKLKESMPMIGMLIGDRTINQLKQTFVAELESLFPKIMQQYAGTLQEDFKPEEMIKQKVNSIPNDAIESFFYQHMPGEMRKLKWYGAFLGFVIGLVQLGIVYLALK